MRVAVIGGGVGGLVLANALRNALVDVELYEATRSSEGRARASRLLLDETGVAALQKSLTPAQLDAVLATAGLPLDGLSVRDAQMQLLSRTEVSDADRHRMLLVDRNVVRDVLTATLGDRAHDGRRFVGYLPRADGRYDVHFVDGSQLIADVVVGADGVDSTVRKLRFPGLKAEPLTTFTFTGRLPMSAYTLLPRELIVDDTIIVGAAGTMLVLAPLRVREGGAQAFAKTVSSRPAPHDAMSWHLTLPRTNFPDADAVTTLRGRALHQLVRAQVTAFAPELRAIIDGSDPDGVALGATHFTSTLPDWEAQPVTLLGDALHAPPPTTPIGVNATLADAARLAEALTAVQHGTPLREAIAGYEAAARANATATLKDAEKAHRLVVSGGNWVRRVRARLLPSIIRFDLWKRRRAATSGA